MASRRSFIFLLLLAETYTSLSQSCHFQLYGKVVDKKTQVGIPFAIVQLHKTGQGISTDSVGNYLISSICAGTVQVKCRYLGYVEQTITLSITTDTEFLFYLSEDTVHTKEVVVLGKKAEEPPLVTQTTHVLQGKELEQTRGNTLGEALKNIPGVYALQTGPSIFKPVIHGMHSNRVLILNNGVRQEGQQWGSEHAPEIDPFVATKLTVIKGPASIRYGSDAIAGVVLVDPASLPKESKIGGEVNLVAASNNHLGVASGILQGGFNKINGLAWRLQGTYRMAGNTKTPDYYLENTGFQEKNYSLAMAYTRLRYGLEVFYSQFNTRLGIFTGASAETIQDLNAAIQRSAPITLSYFSYSIQRPYQLVQHDLFKSSGYVKFGNSSKLQITFARQANTRSEYDYVPLSGRTTPELYLHLTSHTLDIHFAHSLFRRLEGTLGISGITQGNVRQYQLLIPNFRNYGGGVFLIEKWTNNKWTLEGGLRYDYKWLRAYMLDNATAHTITPTFHWQNVTGSLGSAYQLGPHTKWMLYLSTAWRAPTVNELLSDGVHQSALSYEIGNPNLHAERSYSGTTELNYQGKRMSGSIEAYYNYMQGYIFLKPDLSFIHTTRGAFPTFTYTQVDAIFKGIDLSFTYSVLDSLHFKSKTSLLFAYNTTLHDYMQLVPANRFENGFTYGFGNIWKLQHLYASLSEVYVAAQKRVPANSDYAPPPAGYMLLQAELGFHTFIGKYPISLILSASNLLNTKYRDYLDRFRYFTDEPGRTIIIRLKTTF